MVECCKLKNQLFMWW